MRSIKHQNSLLILLVILFIGCEKQSVDPEPTPAASERNVITAGDIPEVVNVLRAELGLQSGISQFSTAGGSTSGELNELTIKWDEILQLIEEDGRETYTFFVDQRNPELYVFYNLVLQFNTEHQAYRPFLLKYTLDPEYAPEYLRTGSLSEFTGRVDKIVLDKNLSVGRSSVSGGRSDANLNGTTCPGGGVNYIGGVGSIGGGSWSSNPPDYQDPDPVGTIECTTYLNYTVWRNGYDNSLIGIEYGSIEVECKEQPAGGSSSDSDGACDNLNGEIPLIDPNHRPFRYPFGSDFETKYPKLTAYLKNGIVNIKDVPKVMNALTEYTCLSSDDIVGELTWGQGPIIDIVDIRSRFNVVAEGVFDSRTPDKIYLSRQLVEEFEAAPSGEASEVLQFFIGVTTLHEYTHHADNRTDCNASGIEEGNLFEEAAYGQVVEKEDAYIIWKGRF